MTMSGAMLRPLGSQIFVIACLIFSSPMSFSFGQEFDPDSIPYSEKVKEDCNPFGAAYSMNSWTMPVLDHEGKPHKDGHVIQIIADGGNGIQDPPNPDGSPGGDDSLAVGSFSIQYVNGEKHKDEGVEPGMFIGMMYFVPYKPNQVIYLRIWDGVNPIDAEYYQDSEEYATFRGGRGGAMVVLQGGLLEDIDWRFGITKRIKGIKESR